LSGQAISRFGITAAVCLNAGLLRRDGSCRPPRTSSAAADQGWHSTDDGRWCGLLIIASGQLYTHFGAERCRSAKSPRAKPQGRFLDVSY
jgi:hypothetical protein